MLILSRGPGEEIEFTLTEPLPAGTRFSLIVNRVNGKNVYIGIEAPRSITVDRAEVAMRKRLENGEVSGNV